MVGTNYGPPVQKRRALVLHFDEAKFLGHWFLCVSRRGGHSAPAHACPTGCCLGPRWSPAAVQLAGADGALGRQGALRVTTTN